VGVTELDSTAKSAENTQTPLSGAAESAALDPDLALILKRWPALPAATKKRIISIIRKK
jgi:hypothetical protein